MTEKNPTVTISTSMGNIRIELDAEKAPITTKNFLDYVTDGLLRWSHFSSRDSRFHDPGWRDGPSDETKGQQIADQERSDEWA